MSEIVIGELRIDPAKLGAGNTSDSEIEAEHVMMIDAHFTTPAHTCYKTESRSKGADL